MFLKNLYFIIFLTMSLFVTACGDSAKRTTINDSDKIVVDKFAYLKQIV